MPTVSPVTRLGTWLMNVILFNSHNDHAKLGTTTHIFTNWEALPNITQLNKVKICIIWFWNLHTEEFYSSTEAQSDWGTCAGFSCLAQSAPQASKLLSKLSAESEATVGLFLSSCHAPHHPSLRKGSYPQTKTSYQKRHSPGEAHPSHYTPGARGSQNSERSRWGSEHHPEREAFIKSWAHQHVSKIAEDNIPLPIFGLLSSSRWASPRTELLMAVPSAWSHFLPGIYTVLSLFFSNLLFCSPLTLLYFL